MLSFTQQGEQTSTVQPEEEAGDICARERGGEGVSLGADADDARGELGPAALAPHPVSEGQAVAQADQFYSPRSLP